MLYVIAMLVIHWAADFYLQSDEMAKGKSKSWAPLLLHTSIYSLVWGITMGMYAAYLHAPFWVPIVFMGITFMAHTITDYFTSRVVSKLFAKQDYHNGFIVIGFDQILHYIQLILTFELLC